MLIICCVLSLYLCVPFYVRISNQVSYKIAYVTIVVLMQCLCLMTSSSARAGGNVKYSAVKNKGVEVLLSLSQ